MDRSIIRAQVRKWALRAPWAVVALVVSALASKFVEAFGEERGWFDKPGERITAVTDFLFAIITSSAFQWIGGALIGFAIGVHIDSRLKPKTPLALSFGKAELKLRYPHTSIEPLIDEGYQPEVDYGKSNFSKSIVDVNKLFDGGFYRKRLVIEDCVLVGPANIVLSGKNVFFQSHFLYERDIEEIMFEISENRSRHMIVSAYKFEDCVIRNCQFYRIGMIGTAETITSFKENVSANAVR